MLRTEIAFGRMTAAESAFFSCTETRETEEALFGKAPVRHGVQIKGAPQKQTFVREISLKDRMPYGREKGAQRSKLRQEERYRDSARHEPNREERKISLPAFSFVKSKGSCFAGVRPKTAAEDRCTEFESLKKAYLVIVSLRSAIWSPASRQS